MTKEREKRSKYASYGKPITKCWECERATDGSCSWMTRWKPMEGWTAQKSTVNGHAVQCGKPYVVKLDTYSVFKCPQFNDKKGETKIDPKGIRGLAAAIMLRAVNDWKRGDDCEHYNRLELKKFFKSEWCLALLSYAEVAPEKIVERLNVY